MNQAQALHAKSLARHIREHAEVIVRRMRYLESEDLTNVPVNVVNNFTVEAEFECKEIKTVIADMQTQLENMPDFPKR